jgi:glycosyltransferase involved in cell wall biosynthesis
MKVLLYGETTAPGSGAWCYAETLRDMGHDVVGFSDSTGLERYRTRQYARTLRKLLGRPLDVDRRGHIAALLAEAGRVKPDIVLVLKGLALGAEDVDTLRARGAWVVNVNHDDFFSANRNNRSSLQLRAVPRYEYVFTTREVNVAEIAPLNSRVEFFPFAYYPRVHRVVPIPPAEREKWDLDVVFVGTWERERCALLEELVRRVPARYAIWGAQWGRVGARSPLRPFIRHAEVVLDDMAKALGGAKVSLAFLRKENRDDYTQRTFEIPACGGLLLGERTARQQSYYREGVEAEFFDPSGPDELVDKVKRLLADPRRREAVRVAGREALLRQRHTYRDRLDRLFELYRRARGQTS